MASELDLAVGSKIFASTTRFSSALATRLNSKYCKPVKRAFCNFDLLPVKFSPVFSACLTTLYCAIVTGRSVRPSVCLPTTRDPRINGSRYQHIHHTIRQKDMFSNFLTSNFLVLSLRIHSKQMC